MKAIDTHYSNHLFRSRLEARWAVFFDTLGIAWEYEKEGYELDGIGNYLPDFWLPQVSMWAEVKPSEFGELELAKCVALTRETGFPCLRLEGRPDFRAYDAAWAIFGSFDPDEPGPPVTLHGIPYVDFDYIVHNLHLDEGRFYSCSGGCVTTNRRWLSCDTEYFNAVNAARSARFEFNRLRMRGA